MSKKESKPISVTPVRLQTLSFPNGFDSWQETHFEVVRCIIEDLNDPERNEALYHRGRGGCYELAEAWTTEFEVKHQDRAWDGEFFDELEWFCEAKVKELIKNYKRRLKK